MKKSRIVYLAVALSVSLLVGLLLIFYLDLANGPIPVLVLSIINIVCLLVSIVFVSGKKLFFKFVPFIAFVTLCSILLPLAKPVMEEKSAVNYRNPVPTEVMHLANGDVRGVYSQDQSVEVYAGIPYAKPPVGELRWKEPQPMDNWEGVRDCSKFGPRSMQVDTNSAINSLVDIYSEKSWHPDYNMHPLQNMSEDSLYLNIWKPAHASTNLPILMFIHGGSLTSGSSAADDYNGEEMAKKGIIMITIQYRLGVFGYFAHPDLASESPNNTTGNYGLLDQIMALSWINDNASYFGGDKDNITIAGESAGSSSISALCTSPLAKGLFKRAIGESSSLVVKKAPHTYRPMNKALEIGEKIMKEQGCSSIEELRKVSASKLVQTKYENSSMILDGYALTKDPYDVYLDGENNEESLLNGYNVKEADAFVIPKNLLVPTNKSNILGRLEKEFGKEIAQRIYDLYKDKIEKDAFNAFNEIYSVYWFIQPHHSWSNMAFNNGLDVYRYQFTKENGFHGTYHSGEMIYAYSNIKRSPRQYAYNESDYALMNTMSSYWANYVKSGDPNGEGLPTWPLYNPTDNKVMELGERLGYIDDAYLELYKIIDDYIDLETEKGNTQI
ncbi:MAG: carboxylesterase family protein [Bacilli bacterium]|nr:carboxylesterase family protein [Bacilli bacterium]